MFTIKNSIFKRLISLAKSKEKRWLLYLYFRQAVNKAYYSLKRIFEYFLYSSESGRKIDLNYQLNAFYGRHRSGWEYALKGLKKLHTPRGVLFDSFIERTFCWHPSGIKPIGRPWVGVVHSPPNMVKWFRHEQSNDYIFNTEAWKESLPYCLGLFTLSLYHKEYLQKRFDFPVVNLLHPTETPKIKWEPQRFLANQNKKIIQIGWWQRKLHSIFLLKAGNYEKIFLRVSHSDMDELIAIERKHEFNGLFDDSLYNSTRFIDYVSNREYDHLLSENLVFIDLYDSSANNVVIECIVRNTPLLVNPLPALNEYLGVDYPFYFNTLEEAARKVRDMDLIMETHHYLSSHPMKLKLTRECFMESVLNSAIYKAV